MAERDYAPLSVACVRGLCDKLYEKRKFAGVEIEKMVKDFSDANNTSQIKRLLRVLGQDLMASTNPNVKSGAMMGLSSVAVGLGKDCAEYLGELLAPVAACLSESESRVRYAAVEALFNVVKVSRGAAMLHFALLFDALARLAGDPEPQVRQAAELLDRLVKDVVAESAAFDVAGFVPLVRERLYARGAPARQFAVAWLCALDSVPHLQLVSHLPELLDGLLKMLDDPNPEIRRMCEVQLGEFLRRVREDPAPARLPDMLHVMITHAQAPEELVQRTALTWLLHCVELSGVAVLPHASGVLAAALPCLAYTDDDRRNIRESAGAVSAQLMSLVGGGAGGEVRLDAVVGVLAQLLQHGSVHTRAAALDWVLHLYARRPEEMSAHTEAAFAACVGCLGDSADDVVRRALAVLAEICSQGARPQDSPYHGRFLRALLRLLAAEPALLEDRGAFVVRQLCVLLSAEDVYRSLADALLQETDLRFVSTMVDVLSTILLTAAELYDLRITLRAFDKPATRALFVSLYPCWCHSAVSLLALCLLTHNYSHCNTLINTFGDLEVTVDFLTEVDKLVQLIESPIFAYMRLELLSSAEAGELRAALYGLLMLLPQTDAFHTLRARLQCLPAAPAPAPVAPRPPAILHPDVDYAALLAEFTRVQGARRTHRMLERTRRSIHHQ